jgi:hypothetical protein
MSELIWVGQELFKLLVRFEDVGTQPVPEAIGRTPLRRGCSSSSAV